jgi:hypothetical protein
MQSDIAAAYSKRGGGDFFEDEWERVDGLATAFLQWAEQEHGDHFRPGHAAMDVERELRDELGCQVIADFLGQLGGDLQARAIAAIGLTLVPVTPTTGILAELEARHGDSPPPGLVEFCARNPSLDDNHVEQLYLMTRGPGRRDLAPEAYADMLAMISRAG